MKKQTAVEWLVEKLDQNFDYVADTIIEQAKEMERQQIIESYRTGRIDQHNNEQSNYNRMSEQYYNETFGKQETIVTECKDGTIQVETFKSELITNIDLSNDDKKQIDEFVKKASGNLSRNI